MMTSAKSPPPRSRGNFLFGSALDFLRDPIQTFMKGWQECGDVVCFRLMGPMPFYLGAPIASRMFGPMEMYLISHPKQIKHVLQDNNRNYTKEPAHSAQLKSIAGDGLTMSEGDLWRSQRRLMQPAFHRHHAATFITQITDATTAMLNEWEAYFERGQPVDLSAEMFRLAFNVVTRTMFSADLRAEADEVVRASATALMHAYTGMRMPVRIPAWLPTSHNRRFMRARRTLEALACRLIAERKRSPDPPRDLLSLLLDNDGDESLARDEILTMIHAGHDTTGAALTWAFYLLARHPEVLDRLYSEVTATSGAAPTLDDLSMLGYAENVFKEAMRLYPPAWVLSRKATSGDEIGNYYIPAGSTVFISPYVTHRHPDFWRNAEEFDPARFNQASPDPGAAVQYAYLPFGGGPRSCIGNTLALMTGQIVVAMVTRAYRLNLIPGQSIAARPKLTLHINGPVLMTLERAGKGCSV